MEKVNYISTTTIRMYDNLSKTLIKQYPKYTQGNINFIIADIVDGLSFKTRNLIERSIN